MWGCHADALWELRTVHRRYDFLMSKDALPVIRTFDFGGVPMVEVPHLALVTNGRQLAEIVVRCLAHNHPNLVHPDAPQLAR